jgi:hypothetical protein
MGKIGRDSGNPDGADQRGARPQVGSNLGLAEADSILIFGPGEAKGELEKRLASKGLSGRVVGVETVDKMTDRQIAAKVRQRFPK